jgi:hypothetical protein
MICFDLLVKIFLNTSTHQDHFFSTQSWLIQICVIVQPLHLRLKYLHLWHNHHTYLWVFLVMYSKSPCLWSKAWDHLLLNTLLSYTLVNNPKTAQIWLSLKPSSDSIFGAPSFIYAWPYKEMHLALDLHWHMHFPKLPMPWTLSLMHIFLWWFWGQVQNLFWQCLNIQTLAVAL